MLRGLTGFLPEAAYSNWDMLEFAIRIIISGVLGCIIGIERASRNKGAGPRTHAIIACTAATLVLLSKYSFADLTYDFLGVRGADPSRISAAIVSGVSFLGMGVIFRQGMNVKGLTTAAGIWATAAVGMCFGSGFYMIGTALAAFILATQFFLHKFPMGSDLYTMQAISITMPNTDEMQATFRKFISDYGGEIMDIDIKRIGAEEIRLIAHVRLRKPITYDAAYDFVQEHEGVTRFVV